MSAKKVADQLVWDDVVSAPDHLDLPDESGSGEVCLWVERLREFRAAMGALGRIVVIGYDEGDDEKPPHLWVGSIPESRP